MPNRRRVPPSRVGVDGAGLPPPEIQAQLRRILNSPEFNATEAQRAFLQYVTARTLAGRADEIKGYTVATEVFGRGADFDQSIDPVVSIQANKLRRALERYYLVAGQNDPIRIDMPKGTYVPSFMPQTPPSGNPSLPDAQPAGAHVDTTWPGIAVQSLANLSGNPELDHLGAVVALEIASEITCCPDILVFPQAGAQSGGVADGARFVLNGSIYQDSSNLRMTVVLADRSTGRQIWADRHRADMNPARLISFGEEVARIVAGKIASEYGIIARQLAMEARRASPVQLNSYEAVLRYHEFNAHFTRRSYLEALAALQQAIENEPECGLVWSMLSRLYAINYGLELFEPLSTIDAAVDFAQTGVKLDPTNQRTRISLAFALMLADELTLARTEIHRSLAMNPECLIFLDSIGYMLTLLGDWQLGPTLIRKAIAVNPFCNTAVYNALWLDLFRRREYEQAYQETLNSRRPGMFWDHLTKTATLGALGRIEEGRKAAAELLRLKPDFPDSGRRLMGRFVKFEEIVARLIDGLGRVGIAVR